MSDVKVEAFLRCRDRAREEVLEKWGSKCKCGRLLTSLRQMNCSRFKKAVDSRTVILYKRLYPEYQD